MLLCSTEPQQKSTGQNVGHSAVDHPLSLTDNKKKKGLFAYKNEPLVWVIEKCNITAPI